MPLSFDDWRNIQDWVDKKIAASVGPYFAQGRVIRNDPQKNLIWLEEFGDQPIPMFAFDYLVKYYDTQPDGVVTTGDKLWSVNDSSVPGVLASGATLNNGQSLYSPNRKYHLTMQGDGNLVLYDSNNNSKWSSGTAGSGLYVTMQGDGNLVIYDNATPRASYWASNTSGVSHAYLSLGDDGSLVISLDGAPINVITLPKFAIVTPVCPKVGEMVLVARQHGSRRLPKCIGVLRSIDFVIPDNV